MKNVARRRWAVTALGLSLLFLSAPPVLAGVKKGDSLPAFTITTPQGQTYNPQSFTDNKVGVLYLFKPDKCKSCIKGLEHLKDVDSQYKEDMTLLGVGKEADASQLDALAKGMGLGFPVVPGDADLFKSLSASLLPVTYLVGPNMRVLQVVYGSGGQISADMLTALGETQLQQNKPAKARTLFLRATKAGGQIKARAGSAYADLKEGHLDTAQAAFAAMAKSGDTQEVNRGKEGLAEVLFQQGKTDDALKLADDVLKADPKSTMANLVKGKSLFAKGESKAAKEALDMATHEETPGDFAWQKAEAHLAMGNLQAQAGTKEESHIALKSFQKAQDSNPYFAEALSNQGVLLKDMGEPEKAMEVFQKLQKINPSDALVHALLRQAQEAIAQKADLERRKYIDGLAQDLIKQFKENKANAPESTDDWTSPVMAVSILGFQNNSQGMLMGRIGMESLLQDELTRALQEEHIKVVERAVLDKVLEELKLGSSHLADPDAALKLGRILAARILTTGSVFNTGQNSVVTLRMVDTESTNIVLSLSENGDRTGVDPTTMAPKFAKAIKAALKDKYPLKGRIAMVEGDTLIINLGNKHGVQPGAVFNVVGEGKPIELNGRILGYRPAKLGSLEVTKVEDLMAYAKVVDKQGDWEANQKIIAKE
jgi:tetratricopeptide (TPR) repeat protein/peroxiredoxin